MAGGRARTAASAFLEALLNDSGASPHWSARPAIDGRGVLLYGEAPIDKHHAAVALVPPGVLLRRPRDVGNGLSSAGWRLACWIPDLAFGRRPPDDVLELQLDRCMALLATADPTALGWLREVVNAQLAALLAMTFPDGTGRRRQTAELASEAALELAREAMPLLDFDVAERVAHALGPGSFPSARSPSPADPQEAVGGADGDPRGSGRNAVIEL